MCVCADCGSNGVDIRVLSAVRVPAKLSEPPISSSQTVAEAWLAEAHREAGFSKPYTVSLSLSLLEATTSFRYMTSEYTINVALAVTAISLQELSASQQEQLQQRAAYLRQQRDKLHALKKEQQKTKQTTTPEEAPACPTPASTTTPPVNTASSSSPLFTYLFQFLFCFFICIFLACYDYFGCHDSFHAPVSGLVRRQWASPRGMGPVPLLFLLLHLQHNIPLTPPSRRWSISALCLMWRRALIHTLCGHLVLCVIAALLCMPTECMFSVDWNTHKTCSFLVWFEATLL